MKENPREVTTELGHGNKVRVAIEVKETDDDCGKLTGERKLLSGAGKPSLPSR